jgi:hypothetical protein
MVRHAAKQLCVVVRDTQGRLAKFELIAIAAGPAGTGDR